MTTGTRPSGRTWRDLPPEPPFGDLPPPPPEPVPPVEPIAPPPESPRRRWAPIVVPVALFVALGATGAVWALTRGGDDEPAPSTTMAVPEPEAPPAQPDDEFLLPPGPDVPGPGSELLPPDFLDRFGRNFFDEFAPGLEIPEELFPPGFFEEFGRDFFGEDGQPFPFPDELADALPPELAEELQRLFDELGRGEFDFSGDRFGDLFPAPGDDGRAFGFGEGMADGVWPAYLPAGYRVASARVNASGDGVFSQELRLDGPLGAVEVVAEGGPDRAGVADAGGDPVLVGEAEGRERILGGRRIIVFEVGETTVTVMAPDDFDRGELLRIAAGLEEAR